MTRRRVHPAGVLLVMLAVVCQLALGALGAPDSAAARQMADLDAMTVLCAAGPAATDHAPAHHHHSRDCELCPVCTGLAAPVALLASAPVLAPPAVHHVAAAAAPPPARAPPARPRATLFPRGPPALA